MFVTSTAKRIRAIFIALAITFVTNYAISYAAKEGVPSSDLKYQTTRSGMTATPPKPPVLPRE